MDALVLSSVVVEAKMFVILTMDICSAPIHLDTGEKRSEKMKYGWYYKRDVFSVENNNTKPNTED